VTLLRTYARYDVHFDRGEGARLWDSEGNEYLDFLSGISVSSVGHCHPAVVAAVREQAGRLIHVGNLFYTEPMERLADRLTELFGGGGGVFFTNSGAEAIEAALKLARKARQGGDVIVARGAFHGRTYGALSATPQESKQAPFAPLVPGFRALDPEAIADSVDERTACVLLEPVQGETGVHVLSDEVLRACREACDRHGAALIFDEIQCGLGRTGKVWGHEWPGVVPDAITTAKALGGGLPIGALITGERLRDVLAPGDHGSTFAGGAVVAAAANASLEVLTDPALLRRVVELGERLRAALGELPRVRDVRGIGLMNAIDVDGDAPELVRRALFEQRLVLNATGPATIRMLPPLIIGEPELDDAVGRLRAVLDCGDRHLSPGLGCLSPESYGAFGAGSSLPRSSGGCGSSPS
jgi:predicted acetylornithine/succinylornithine family transaminase